MKWIRLIRLTNIIIIFFSQALVYFGLMKPTFDNYGIKADLDLNEFIIVFIVTAITTMAGYLINDIFDIQTDQINKAGRNIVGRTVSVKSTKTIYLVLLAAGLLISTYHYIIYDSSILFLSFLIISAVLALYAFRLKGSFLFGNLFVAILSAFVIAIILLLSQNSMEALNKVYPLSHTSLSLITKAFIIFAFLSSFFREVVKDIEDIEGDRAAKIQTTAVVLGQNKTKIIAIVIGLILMSALIFWSFHSLNQISIWLQMFGGLLSLYTLLILLRLWRANDKPEFGKVSSSIKLLMGAGLMYLILYSILI